MSGINNNVLKNGSSITNCKISGDLENLNLNNVHIKNSEIFIKKVNWYIKLLNKFKKIINSI